MENGVKISRRKWEDCGGVPDYVNKANGGEYYAISFTCNICRTRNKSTVLTCIPDRQTHFMAL